MALRITEKNGVIELAGNLNAKTSNSLKRYLDTLKELKEDIRINIDNLKQIDFSGQLFLNKLKKACLLV